MKEVTEVLVTYGLYDLVIRIEAKSLARGLQVDFRNRARL
jgi:uncharacterized protein with GYD domain